MLKEDMNDLINDMSTQLKSVNIKANDKTSTKETIPIPEWLKDCECPFLWNSQEERGLGSDQVIQRSLEKLDELKLDEPGFSLQRFITLLKLVLEYQITGDIGKSREYMKTVEDLLEKEASGDDSAYQKVKLSLGHTVTSTKAHLLALDGEEEKSQKIGKNIIPIKIMASHEQASLYSMKSRYFLYSGYENGEAVGVKFARMALELEPSNGEFEYLLAKMLRQQRREIPFSDDIPREELILLESAVQKSKKPEYLVYLAQVYRECGSQAFRQYKTRPNFFNSELHNTIENMSVKALNYYKEALELSSDSPAVLRRVGYGIMNLPKKVADYKLALKCLQQSLELSENPLTWHILGTFYNRHGNDNRKALEYFEKCAKTGSHAGISDMVRLKYILDPDYNPCADLESGLRWEMKKKDRTHIIIQLGSYFLFIKRDLPKSVEYFNKVIAEDSDAPLMKTFKSIFLRMNETIDLYKYLVNEALLFLKNKSSTTGQHGISSSGKEQRLVEDIVDKISEIHPELMEITPDSSLIDKLLQTSNEIKERDAGRRDSNRNSFYGARGNFNSRNRDSSGPNYQRRGGRGRNTNVGQGSQENTFSSSNRKEYLDNPRGGETSTENNFERRGRFSLASQRNKEENREQNERKTRFNPPEGNSVDNSERRERCSRSDKETADGDEYERKGRSSQNDNSTKTDNFGRRERYSQRGRSYYDRDQKKTGEVENWRKK